MYRDPAERAKWCNQRDYQIPLLVCLRCRKFPCPEITPEDLKTLEESLFTKHIFEGFKARRSGLYIFKYADGTLKSAPPGFSIENPDMALLERVDEVYVISKTMVKQTRLVMKDKKEVAAIRQTKAQSK